MDRWLRYLSMVALVGIVAMTVLGLGTTVVLSARQTNENRQAISELRAQNMRQSDALTRGLQVLCQSSLNALIIDKALRNLGQQAGLDVSGIPTRLPPETEKLCAELSPS